MALGACCSALRQKGVTMAFDGDAYGYIGYARCL